MVESTHFADRDFAIGLAQEYQWADSVAVATPRNVKPKAGA